MKCIDNKSIFNICMYSLFAFIIIKYVFGFPLPESLYIPLVALLAFTSNRDQLIGVATCCIPLRTVIQTVPWLFICLLVYFVKFSRHKLHFNYEILLVTAIVIWELLHNCEYEFSIITLLSFIVPYVFCIFVMSLDSADLDYATVVRILSRCSVFMGASFIGRVFVLSKFNLVSTFDNIRRLGSFYAVSNESRLSENPNTLGFICLFGTIGLFQLWITHRCSKADLFVIVGLILTGFLTLSRTFIVCLMILLLLLMFSINGSTRKKIRMVAKIGVAGIAVSSFVIYFMPDAMEKFLKRFRVDDISNNRNQIFMDYNHYIFSDVKHLFWGLGLQNYPNRINNISIGVPHNGVQEVVLVWGLVGLFIIILFLFSLYYTAKRTNKNIKIINFVPLIMILLKIQAGQFVSGSFNIVMLAVAYLSLCHEFSGTENGEGI